MNKGKLIFMYYFNQPLLDFGAMGHPYNSSAIWKTSSWPYCSYCVGPISSNRYPSLLNSSPGIALYNPKTLTATQTLVLSQSVLGLGMYHGRAGYHFGWERWRCMAWSGVFEAWAFEKEPKNDVSEGVEVEATLSIERSITPPGFDLDRGRQRYPWRNPNE